MHANGNPPAATPDESTAPARSSPMIRMIAALLITLLGGLLYIIQIDVPWIRRTGLPSLIIMLVGTAAGLHLARKHRSWIGLTLATVSALATGVFVYFMYVATLPPAVDTVAVGRPAPDFTLPNHEGKPIRLADYRGVGPVLLVFYRGFW